MPLQRTVCSDDAGSETDDDHIDDECVCLLDKDVEDVNHTKTIAACMQR